MSNPGNKVYLNRVFNAPMEKVFHALTTPTAILEWFGPKNCKTISADISLEVGGEYQFEIETKSATRFFVEGKYLEINHPTRLVYTAEYRDLPGASDMKSVITFILTEVVEGTALSFIQELSWTPKDIENRAESWELMFSKLENSL